MQILQAKIRGTNSIQDSGWVNLSQHLTIIQGNDDLQRKEFLTTLETINPLFDIHFNMPFRHFPNFSTVNGHKKRIQPHKKTAAYSIFSITPDLTLELAKIDPTFYETDRIEVGRRLDYSRWVNFVEMSASTRWKEFEELAQPLIQSLSSSSVDALLHIINTYKTNDRIIGTFSKKLTLWITKIAPELSPEHSSLHQQCYYLIGRSKRFYKARRHFKNNLPPYIFLEETPHLKGSYSLVKISQKRPTNPLELLLYRCSDILKTVDNVSAINDSIITIRKEIIKKMGHTIRMPDVTFTESHLKISLSDSKTETESNYLLTLILLSKLLFQSPPIILLHDIEQKKSKDMQANFFERILHISKICQIILSTNADMEHVKQNHRMLQFDQNSNSGKIIDISP